MESEKQLLSVGCQISNLYESFRKVIPDIARRNMGFPVVVFLVICV